MCLYMALFSGPGVLINSLLHLAHLALTNAGREMIPNASAVCRKPVHLQPLGILGGSQTSVYCSLALDDTEKALRVILLNPLPLGLRRGADLPQSLGLN